MRRTPTRPLEVQGPWGRRAEWTTLDGVAESRSVSLRGAVVTVTWDAAGHLHVDVEIDAIPDAALIDGVVPLDISVNHEQVFPPPDEAAQEAWDDEL